MANNQFIDTARITVRAGDGGGGAVAFHREKYGSYLIHDFKSKFLF